VIAGNTWSLKRRITRLESQNRKFAQIFIVTEAKSAHFCGQTKWVCPSGAPRIFKNDSDSSLKPLIVTRIESFCKKRQSRRVTIFCQRDSSRVRVTKNRDSTRVTDSGYAITDIQGRIAYSWCARCAVHTLWNWIWRDIFRIVRSR